MVTFFNNSFKENMECGLRGYLVTWCPRGLEAELIKREMIQTIVKMNPRNHRLYGFSGEFSIISTAGTCVVGTFLRRRITCSLLFVISQINSIFSTRTCDMFMQRMLFALQENNSL